MDNDIEKIQVFFEGLIDYFFDPCEKDESHREVLCLIEHSKKNKRLGKEIIPPDTMSSLCSSGWNYQDYAKAIQKAAENWENAMGAREAIAELNDYD